MKNEFSDVPVFVFSYEERTIDFCKHCLNRIGFTNIFSVYGKTTFYEKLIEFSEIASDLNEDFYIRVDADRFVFDGVIDLIREFIDLKLDNCQGVCFDFLMNKTRHSTPHIYSNHLIKEMQSKNIKILDSNKPESDIMKQVKNKKNINILTNLHDYEQYPSKVTNTFINRLYRNHGGHYNWNQLKGNGLEREIEAAFIFHKDNGAKTDCSYIEEFKKFDLGTPSINSSDFPSLYDKYYQLYNQIKLI